VKFSAKDKLAENTENSLSAIFLLSKKVGRVAFSDVVKASSGFNVVPLDATNDKLDKELISNFNSILSRFLKTSASTRSRFQGSRVNEVGRRIEELLVNELNKQPLSVKKLGSAGYPDIEITHSGRTIYLEMKTSSVILDSSFRYFYYTSGKKIKSNAKHLLLDITVSEESPHYWKIEKWALSDLSRLKLRLKCEFNASKSDLLDKEARLLLS
jgi:hypothetical protein